MTRDAFVHELAARLRALVRNDVVAAALASAGYVARNVHKEDSLD